MNHRAQRNAAQSTQHKTMNTTTQYNIPQNYTQCWYCSDMYLTSEKYCPTCRRKPKDDSGRHKSAPQVKPVKIEFPSIQDREVSVHINRGQGLYETLQVKVKEDCVTFIRASWNEHASQHEELFPKAGEKVWCVI